MSEQARTSATVPMPLVHGFDSILAAARTGAEWAWKVIYEELAPCVLGYLRAHGAPEPEDMTGEVFLQVVRDLHGFEGDEAEFRAWVLTIAHHRLVDGRRYASRRPVDPAGPEVLISRGPAGDGEQDALEMLARAQVNELIGRLPSSQRAVLLLRVVGGLTIEQVAAAIGKRSGAVKALQRRGLATLEKELFRETVPI